MKETKWVDVIGYEGIYLISNTGLIKSLPRATNNQHTDKCTMLKFGYNSFGYRHYALSKNGKKKTFRVNRLVALHFVKNENNKPCVHHIDHNKENNSSENLMWVTYSENIKYNYTTGGQIGKSNMKGKFGKLNVTSKPVIQMDINGNKIKEHDSAKIAARFVGGDFSHISKVCRGLLTKHKGYKWQYA